MLRICAEGPLAAREFICEQASVASYEGREKTAVENGVRELEKVNASSQRPSISVQENYDETDNRSTAIAEARSVEALVDTRKVAI